MVYDLRLEAPRVRLHPRAHSRAHRAPADAERFLPDLQRGAGNRAVARLLEPARQVQRANLVLGQPIPQNASPKQIADQTEIFEAAAAVDQRHGQAPALFATGNLDPPPTKNWITGHSDGSVIAGLGEAYNAATLAPALVARGIQNNALLRILGCSTGAAPGYLAEATSRELSTNHHITGVRIRGAKGILIKTTAKAQGGTSGVYRTVHWAGLNTQLTTAFRTLLQGIVARLTNWVAALGSDEAHRYAVDHLTNLVRAVNAIKGDAMSEVAILQGSIYFDDPRAFQARINPQLNRISSQLRTTSVQTMEQRFGPLRLALDAFERSVQGEGSMPQKITFAPLWGPYFQDVQNRTLLWLRHQSVDPMSRETTGNITWVTVGGGQLPRIAGQGGHQRRHSTSL